LKNNPNINSSRRRSTIAPKQPAKVPPKILKVDSKAIKELADNALLNKIIKSNKQELEKFDLNLSGCSATIVIQTSSKLFISWVGDCHAMLCTKERKFQAIKLTQNTDVVHSPLNHTELKRIYCNKGEVKTGLTLSGDKKPRVYVRGRMYPGLSTTRSLGDLLAHQIGVTSEPSIIVHKVSK